MLAEEPDDFTADATHVYGFDAATMELYREPIGGGMREVLLATAEAIQLQLGGDGFLYYGWTSFDDVISRVAITGGTAEDVVDAGIFDLSGYRVTAEGVFWSDYRGLYFTPYDQPMEKQLFRANSTGVGLATDHYVLEVTADRLYWVHHDFPAGTVGWTKRDQTDCDAVLDGGNDFDWAAVGADGFLYVSTFSTADELYRIPLP